MSLLKFWLPSLTPESQSNFDFNSTLTQKSPLNSTLTLLYLRRKIKTWLRHHFDSGGYIQIGLETLTPESQLNFDFDATLTPQSLHWNRFWPYFTSGENFETWLLLYFDSGSYIEIRLQTFTPKLQINSNFDFALTPESPLKSILTLLYLRRTFWNLTWLHFDFGGYFEIWLQTLTLES